MPMNNRLLVPRANGLNPRSISGLGLWLDASDASSLTMNSSTVSQINDKSGNARHFSQGTALNQPSLSTLNGRQCLLYAGNQVLNGNAASLAIANAVSGITAFLALKNDSVAVNYTHLVLSRNGSASQARYTLASPTSTWRLGGRRLEADSFASITSASSTAATILCGVLDYANSDAFLFVNGTQTATSTSFQTDGTTDASDSAANSLGAVPGGAEPVSGLIGEILVWRRALTASERSRVTRYLGTKWGITVA